MEKRRIKLFEKFNSKDLIVVDIQPSYRIHFGFKVEDFINYMYNFDKIYYLYNGKEMGMEDNVEILSWLVEYGLDLDEVNIDFFEKGYGFYRDLMEYLDEDKIIKLGKFLKDKRYYDLREINDKDVHELVENEFPRKYVNGHNYFFCLRDDIYEHIRYANNPVLVGGGQYECLKEVEILMQIFNMNYEINYTFVY